MSDYLSEFGSFLKRPLGNNLDNDQDDVLQTREKLKKAGYEAGEQDRPYMDAPLEKAIRSFQKDKGLYVDGYMEPGGETENALHSAKNKTPLPASKPKWIGSNETKGAVDRYRSIIENKPGKFLVKENPDAKSKDPISSINLFGKDVVKNNEKDIEELSKKHNVDSDLVKSVFWAENARGYYGHVFDKLNLSDSYFPGNINTEYWKKLPVEDINTKKGNIEASIILLKRIEERMPDPTPAKITSVWHGLDRDYIDDLGAHVDRLYREKPWKKNDRK